MDLSWLLVVEMGLLYTLNAVLRKKAATKTLFVLECSKWYSLKGDALIFVGDFSWCLVQCAGSALQGIRQPLNFPFKVLDLLFLHLEQLVKMFLMLYQFCCVAPYNTGPIPLLKQLAYSVEGSRMGVPSFVYQQELSTGRNASSIKLLSFQHAYPLDFSKRHVVFPFPVGVAH